MSHLKELYKPSLSLLTDLYQLTMAYGYWKSGKATQEGIFHLHFRENPFEGGFTIAAGLEQAVQFLETFKISQDDVDYLATLNGRTGEPLFEKAFLDYLFNLEFSCDVAGVPEGTCVFPFEPLLRVKGPLLQCQLLETPLLNLLNFPTLIATKAARINLATGYQPVMEFGLRRAQGIDGSLTASRAAYIGGCTSTSNVLAGKTFGIPVAGTHAHSWIMSFNSELEAFQAYAQAMPDNCIFLVDTYNTLEGVRNAIKVGQEMRKMGKEMIGIRLDSGDLAWFSIKARKLLDEAGFKEAIIVASNDLDEKIVNSLKRQEAAINVWGIGTRLVTAYDQPALGGVYKLSEIKIHGKWEPKIKLSEQTIKINTPGMQQIRRFYKNGEAYADMIYDEITTPEPGNTRMIHFSDYTKQLHLDSTLLQHKDLLVPLFEEGKIVYQHPALKEIREHCIKDVASFNGSFKRFVNPHIYKVGLEAHLHHSRDQLIRKYRHTNNQV